MKNINKTLTRVLKNKASQDEIKDIEALGFTVSYPYGSDCPRITNNDNNRYIEIGEGQYGRKKLFTNANSYTVITLRSMSKVDLYNFLTKQKYKRFFIEDLNRYNNGRIEEYKRVKKYKAYLLKEIEKNDALIRGHRASIERLQKESNEIAERLKEASQRTL